MAVIMARIEPASIQEDVMMNREEYVQKLKAQLDEWNAEAKKWEQKAQEAQAGMKAEYEKQLAHLNSQREQAMYQMKLLQSASQDAWQDMMKGADQAWKSMQEAFDRARSHFEKK
jgi:lipid II:glycine glycyltransferase (peptidoglycan interpeptide bridge formation enzyme)